MFKVFHFLYQKAYSLNSETAINKYKIFKDNLKLVKEHNAKNLSWTLEINQFGDMTLAEIKSYLGVTPIPLNKDGESPSDNRTPEIKGDNVFATFDALVDAAENGNAKDDEEPIPPQQGILPEVDHKRFLSGVREQGNCGSCWAFASALTIEASYNIKYNSANGQMYPYVSTQEMVDCTMNGTYACFGGWMHEAYKSLATLGVMSERNYPYEERYVGCRTQGKTYTKLIAPGAYEGCSWNPYFFGKPVCTKDSWHQQLQKGPISVVLMAEDNFARYRSGIIDSSRFAACDKYDHAVVAYAWKHYKVNGAIYEYIEIRNSHGLGYGDKGDVRYFYTPQNGTCHITKLGFRPLIL
jgi:hypothetical protein